MQKPRLPKEKRPAAGLQPVSRGKCRFLKPSKQAVGDEIVVTLRCTAFVPGFEVGEDGDICGICAVPAVIVPGRSCRYLSPLDINDGKTRFSCRKTHKKYILPEHCILEFCKEFAR